MTDNILAKRKSTQYKQRFIKHCTENKRLPNTNPTKTKQKIAQHEPHQNKAKDCPTRTPPKQNKRLPNTNPTKTKQKIAQHEPHQNKTKEKI
jgi:ribosomal protein L39E